MEPLITEDPRVVGPFELLARLGAGGMGVAYLARGVPADDLSGRLNAAYNMVETDGLAGGDGPRRVVVKMIQPRLLDGDPQYRERFGREIDAVRAVVSDRVPALVAFDEHPSLAQPWFAMEYVEGPSLYTMVKESGTFGLGPYVALGLALVDALRAIHGANLLHRDLKPENVVLGPDGPMVLDFGLAVLIERASNQALTATNTKMGTRSYMPLEQYLDAKRASRPADVYALGATLFFALTGRSPYPYGPSTSEPQWDGIPSPFLPLLAKILVHIPAQRPDLDAVESSLLKLLVDADLPPENAARQLADRVKAADLAPKLPPGAPAGQVDPEVQDLVRKAVDVSLSDMDSDFLGIVDTDQIEWALETADQEDEADRTGGHPPAPVGPQPEPQPEPTVTSHPLTPTSPADEPAGPEPRPTASKAPPRAAQNVAADLRKRYALRGDL